MKDLAVTPKIDNRMKIQNIISKRTAVRNLSIFTIVVLASGWIGHALDIQIGNTGTETLGMGLWLVTPFLFSLLLRVFAGDGWKDFGIKPNLKGNLVWYTIAILIYPVMTALALLIGGGSGLIKFPNFSPGALGLILQAFTAGLLPMLIKNLFEEGAWRGYLAPKIYSLGLNAYAGHILVGLIWGAWHIPYYLFFLDRAYLGEFTTLSVAAYIPLTMLVYISWAMVFGEIRLLTNSLWPALIMHAVEDALLLQIFELKIIQITPGADWLISPMNGFISILFFIAVGIALRQWRNRKTSDA
jgi:membrane protease YdiL (CAAX protease family)